MSEHRSNPRRRFLKQSAVVSGAMAAGLPGILRAQSAPAILSADRPLLEQGLQIGDVFADRAIVWSRSDRPARMIVEWSTSDSFTDPRRVVGPHALEVSDFTARVDLTDLPSDRELFVRVKFQD